jgi:two-component system, chemotaxis family, CheB/CheR fusion protein
VGVIGILRDVSEQKRAEEKIQEAVRRRDKFLAMLSHELRNPLGAVVAATALLKKSSPDQHAGFVRILDRQSTQMARLLDDLLEVSRVSQDKIDLRRRVFDLGPVVRDAADASRTLMQERGLELGLDVQPEPLMVDGDPARLQQVVANLLNNAAKYTPRGGHVALEARRDGDRVVIVVRDDGAGIREDLLEAVFDLFVQSSETLDRAQGGLGVGLTLVRSLVGMHGGDVTAHSDGAGKGSAFVVRLPLARGQDELQGPQRPESGPGLPRGASIVLVEDNADTRVMLSQLLTLAGFRCLSASDGPSGLALIERSRPAAAVIDLGLPEMDGFDLARAVRVRSDIAGTYLVAVTGYGQRADRAAALSAGFDEHLVKPADPARLIALLSRDEGDRAAPIAE